jgi:tyrosinase
MTNFLSPVDPIFFLHHSNMDRLWDVWTRKQQRLGLPILPSGADLDTLAKEPFLFYVNGNGQFVGTSHAGDYFSTERFQYDYEPGSGEDDVAEAVQPQKKTTTMLMSAEMKANAATLSIPRETLRAHLASDEPVLVAEVRVQRPSSSSHTREFDVLVGAPAGITRVDADSPHYAGTIAFFGHMSHMGHGAHGSADTPGDATFAVPLPVRAEAFGSLEAASVAVSIRIVPAHPLGKATALRSVSVRAVQ